MPTFVLPVNARLCFLNPAFTGQSGARSQMRVKLRIWPLADTLNCAVILLILILEDVASAAVESATVVEATRIIESRAVVIP
jgi:hypothetical protein